MLVHPRAAYVFPMYVASSLLLSSSHKQPPDPLVYLSRPPKSACDAPPPTNTKALNSHTTGLGMNPSLNRLSNLSPNSARSRLSNLSPNSARSRSWPPTGTVPATTNQNVRDDMPHPNKNSKRIRLFPSQLRPSHPPILTWIETRSRCLSTARKCR